MQAPNRTTELMSAAEDEGKSPGRHFPSSQPLLSQPDAAAASETLRLALPTHSGPRQMCRIQTAELVAMARIVPVGIDFWCNSPGQNTGVDSLSLLQGIFPTEELCLPRQSRVSLLPPPPQLLCASVAVSDTSLR